MPINSLAFSGWGGGREQDENHRLNFNFYLAAMELQCAVHSDGEFRSEENRQLL